MFRVSLFILCLCLVWMEIVEILLFVPVPLKIVQVWEKLRLRQYYLENW